MAPSLTLVEFDPVKSKPLNRRLDDQEDHDLVLRTFRVLIADLVQHFNGGHPGYVPQLIGFSRFFQLLTRSEVRWAWQQLVSLFGGTPWIILPTIRIGLIAIDSSYQMVKSL